MYKLFLDDVRIPYDCAKYMHTKLGPDNLLYLENDWIIARNFEDFKTCIRTYGIPDIVSFDHDLGDDIADARVEAGMSKRKARAMKKLEKDGNDCAKFLMVYCIGNEQFPEKIFVHSMNPVGVDRIEATIKDYKKLYEKSLGN